GGVTPVQGRCSSPLLQGGPMLDPKYIVEHFEAVKKNCQNRNVQVAVDRIPELYDRRKRLRQEIDTLKQTQRKPSVQEQQARGRYKQAREAHVRGPGEEGASAGPAKPAVDFPSFSDWLEAHEPDLARTLPIVVIKHQLAAREKELQEVEAELDGLLRQIPNLS